MAWTPMRTKARLYPKEGRGSASASQIIKKLDRFPARQHIDEIIIHSEFYPCWLTNKTTTHETSIDNVLIEAVL